MDVAAFCPAVATVLEGFSTIGTGSSAISTGLSLFSKIPVLNVIAVISIAIGVTTVALGINQVISGVTGTNVIKEAFRMSDSVYEAVYLGLNIASMVCAITGQIAIGLKGVQCFIGGTLVATEDGLKPIENIQVGDKVLAYDEETGEQAYKKVVRLFRNETYEWYHIFVNDEEIVCTGGHPFYVLNAEEDRKVVRYEGVKSDKNGRWIEAKELKKDDKLLLSDESYGIIISVKIEELVSPETTYNFEVADFHTYYVGESEVLVHNTCGANSGTPEQDFYRGGNDMTLKPNEYKIKDGLVVPGKDGVSVNLNASEVAKFGQPYKVVNVPKGLTIAQKGLNPAHYVIRPAYAMTLSEYQALLYEVVLIPV